MCFQNVRLEEFFLALFCNTYKRQHCIAKKVCHDYTMMVIKGSKLGLAGDAFIFY